MSCAERERARVPERERERERGAEREREREREREQWQRVKFAASSPRRTCLPRSRPAWSAESSSLLAIGQSAAGSSGRSPELRPVCCSLQRSVRVDWAGSAYLAAVTRLCLVAALLQNALLVNAVPHIVVLVVASSPLLLPPPSSSLLLRHIDVRCFASPRSDINGMRHLPHTIAASAMSNGVRE